MTKTQRMVLLVAIFASFVANLDGSIVNVALPAIAEDLGGDLATQEWIVNSYLITLGSFMLVAGSFSDLFGRKKVLVYSLIGFGVASLLCAIAPTALFLIIARGIQGIAGAFLVPSSLALIMSSFSGPSEGKAIGTWTAWTVVAPAIGPLIGGFLVDFSSWRYIFAINIIPIAISLFALHSFKLKEQLDKTLRIDSVGAFLCVVALGSISFALIEQPHFGWSDPRIYIPLIVGAVMFAAFLIYESRIKHGMLPLELFKVRNFSVGNVSTAFVYGALAVAIFLLSIFIQQIAGYSAFEAGLVTLPITILMFLLSPFFGRLSGKYGPRFFMGIGPIIMAIGFITWWGLDETVNYWTQVLPGMLLFGIGMGITVAPLTAAILGSISKSHSGIGSAVNNAVSRVAGLIGIAALGIVVGPTLTIEGFQSGVVMMAVMMGLGGIVSLIGITNRALPSGQPVE